MEKKTRNVEVFSLLILILHAVVSFSSRSGESNKKFIVIIEKTEYYNCNEVKSNRFGMCFTNKPHISRDSVYK